MPKKNFFPKEPVIPSRVTDCLSIVYRGKTEKSDDDYTSDYSEEEEDSEASLLRPFVKTTKKMEKLKEMKKKNMLKERYDGIWMLFYNNKNISLARGMTHQDYMWQFAKQLVDHTEKTYITSAHCSTGNPFPYGTDPNTKEGLICFFTEDYRNKYQVKKAAEAIHQVFNYPKDMYYKTQEATISGLYRHFGNKCVSLYKFTTDNRLYERDHEDVYLWNPVMLED